MKDKNNIDRKILKPIGLMLISVIGLISIIFSFNKWVIGGLFILIILDSITELKNK